jgi:uncharacterized membrane protein YdjX (TVP38/TMEM64 family)
LHKSPGTTEGSGRSAPTSTDEMHLDTTMEIESPSVDTSNEEADEELSEDELKRQRRNRNIRRGVGLFLLAFLIFVIVDSQTNAYIKSGMESFLEWVEANPGGGVLVFMLVIFCTTMLFIPGIILTFGAGYAFANAFGLGVGILLGTIAVFVGASAGAILSFLVGRFLLRDCVAGLTKKFKLFEALDNAMEDKGFRILLLLRLSPVIYASPYLNYGAGGMAVSFKAYVLSLVAILPATVMFVFLGASAGSLADSSGGDSKTTTIVLVIGIIFSIFAVALTSYYARQELRKVTARAASQQQQQNNTNMDQEDDEEMGDADSAEDGGNLLVDGEDKVPSSLASAEEEAPLV